MTIRNTVKVFAVTEIRQRVKFFTADSVTIIYHHQIPAAGDSQKLVRRHPREFGDVDRRADNMSMRHHDAAIILIAVADVAAVAGAVTGANIMLLEGS